MNTTRSRARNLVRCNCNECNGTYVDPRTRNRHIMNRNIVDTPISLQNSDPIIETSQHSSLQNKDYPIVEAESDVES